MRSVLCLRVWDLCQKFIAKILIAIRDRCEHCVYVRISMLFFLIYQWWWVKIFKFTRNATVGVSQLSPRCNGRARAGGRTQSTIATRTARLTETPSDRLSPAAETDWSAWSDDERGTIDIITAQRDDVSLISATVSQHRCCLSHFTTTVYWLVSHFHCCCCCF